MLKRFLKIISEVRPKFREKRNWFLFHVTALSHSAMITKLFLAVTHLVVLPEQVIVTVALKRNSELIKSQSNLLKSLIHHNKLDVLYNIFHSKLNLYWPNCCKILLNVAANSRKTISFSTEK